MSSQLRRYVFIDFESLKKVKFKKLEKVCDKLFILINTNQENIPFKLAMNMQRLGRGVKWVVVDDPKEIGLNYHLCFLLGKLHQRINKDIEFAILSNDETFDPLINYINTHGRSCLRVKRKKNKVERSKEIKKEKNDDFQNGNAITKKTDEEQLPFIIDTVGEGNFIEDSADETVERLKYTGNRPAEVLLLRDYILLHNQELSKNGNADEIIDMLVEKEKIEIKKGVVKYNF